MKILVLTNCIFREKLIEEQLHLLGNEVFISKALLSDSLTMVRFFDIIILSDTLPVDQQLIIANKMLSFQVPIMKMTSEESFAPTEIFRGVLNPDCDLEDLGNSLAVVSKLKKPMYRERPIIQAGKNEEEVFYLRLSKKEKKLLDCLREAKGETVSKKDISLYLWNGEPTASRMCHVSNLIKHLRDKLEKYEPDWYKIITVWGQGYYLKDAHDWDESAENNTQENLQQAIV
ncbi:winged helix-turn-helix domain-containing protein [Enterococcus sp. AZ072]|uniref:winged helix-turn-helix domain-containing protein n=1 Tax=unclassified Enterococcus TaxID=2608891 RepID=UPI003D2A5F2F